MGKHTGGLPSGEETWEVFTLPRSIRLLVLAFPVSHPTQDKRGLAPPTRSPPTGPYLSAGTSPSLFILPAGDAPGRQHFKANISPGAVPELTCSLSPPPNTSEPCSLTQDGVPTLGSRRHSFSLHLSLAETFRLDRWLSSLPTGTRLLWL